MGNSAINKGLPGQQHSSLRRSHPWRHVIALAMVFALGVLFGWLLQLDSWQCPRSTGGAVAASSSSQRAGTP